MKQKIKAGKYENEIDVTVSVCIPVRVTVGWEDDGAWEITALKFDAYAIAKEIETECDVEIGEEVARDVERVQEEDEDDE